MNYLEIQSKMVAAFTELKTLELRIQNTQTDLDKALKEEQTCKEGLEYAIDKSKDIKNQDLVNIEKYFEACKSKNTVERFLEQSKSRRLMIQTTLTNLNEMKRRIQECYDNLGNSLTKVEHNIISLYGN
jgi:chromosome segregation ATPase